MAFGMFRPYVNVIVNSKTHTYANKLLVMYIYVAKTYCIVKYTYSFYIFKHQTKHPIAVYNVNQTWNAKSKPWSYKIFCTHLLKIEAKNFIVSELNNTTDTCSRSGLHFLFTRCLNSQNIVICSLTNFWYIYIHTVQRLMSSKGAKRTKFYHITVILQYSWDKTIARSGDMYGDDSGTCILSLIML